MTEIVRPSGSGTDSLLGCTFPYGREADEEDEPSAAALFGLESHVCFNKLVRGAFTGKAPTRGKTAPAETPDRSTPMGRARATFIEFQAWFKGRAHLGHPTLIEGEVSYALDTRATAETFGSEHVRRCAAPDPKTHQYKVAPYEFPMTLDFVAWFPSTKTVVVVDYKTGAMLAPTPSQSGQLKTGALAAGTFHGAERALLGFAWAPEDGEPAMLWDAQHMLALKKQHLREIREAFGRIGDFSMRPWRKEFGGENWCTYCEVRRQCPVSARELVIDAADALGEAVARRSALVVNGSAEGVIIPREELGRIIKQRSAIEKLNRQLGPLIQADIEANGPAVYNGKEYTVETTKPFDAVSIRSIRDALGPKADREIERLKKLGCVEERTMTRIQARNE